MTGIYRERGRKLAHKGVVWGVYVAQAFRKHGVGRRLIVEALHQAAAMPGLRQVNVGANTANPAAVGLYQSLGFEKFGLERGSMSVDGVLYDEFQMSRLVAKP